MKSEVECIGGEKIREMEHPGVRQTERIRGKWTEHPRWGEREMVFKRERNANGKQNE